jgi:hypothetical protein
MDAAAFEAVDELNGGRLPFCRRRHQALHSESCTRLALTQTLVQLAGRRRAAVGVPARRHAREAEVTLDAANRQLAPAVVVALRYHRAVEPNARGQDMNVVMLRVAMPDDDELRPAKPHLTGVARGDGVPLLVTQRLARRERQARVVDGALQLRPELTHLAELGGEVS